ncbi:CarD family transcriptional regulator [Orenia metallireducens]|uniref:Transcriptional regulator, CarD family n=1 Tax=Orenia metallireducens TaxID=1413210 RepID=A0A285H8M5_9FIRM|nr:CarD family transcriptional regulator [Orenia metallireducens]PRX26177.1 CarD family transcriptional regulator [Orenia metallireducens]SNY32078.1 transcriptional regulator, CarD family [Orenia metallireducens]
MFEVGDKIVYPNHGAGTIIDIEQKEILGEKKQYYIMKLPIGDMKVMIPKDNVEEIGLRNVVNSDMVSKVYQVLKGDQSEMSQNWNRRFRANTEKIKTGDIFEVAEVVRNLTIRDIVKGLSTGEKKMLNNSRQILISELVLAEGKDEKEVEEKINTIFEEQEFEEE